MMICLFVLFLCLEERKTVVDYADEASVGERMDGRVKLLKAFIWSLVRRT